MKVSDYMYDPEEKNGKKPCIKNKHVELMSKLFMYGLERQFKNFVQIICGYLMFRKFLPFWDVITKVCNLEVQISGDWGAENLFAVLTSILFWTFSPLYLHLLINSFVYGMLPKCLSHHYEASALGRTASTKNMGDTGAETQRKRRKSMISAENAYSKEEDDKSEKGERDGIFKCWPQHLRRDTHRRRSRRL